MTFFDPDVPVARLAKYPNVVFFPYDGKSLDGLKTAEAIVTMQYGYEVDSRRTTLGEIDKLKLVLDRTEFCDPVVFGVLDIHFSRYGPEEGTQQEEIDVFREIADNYIFDLAFDEARTVVSDAIDKHVTLDQMRTVLREKFEQKKDEASKSGDQTEDREDDS